jgi:Polyketide cyclase / dehydrase and lipid transport
VIPVALDTHISAPREEIFDFVADIAARPSWNDHFQSEFHLTRPRTSAVGSAARYRTDPPFQHQLYSDLAIVEMDRPRRLVEEGVQGKLNRGRVQIVWDFTQEAPTLTRVGFEMRSEAGSRLHGVVEALGARGYYKRQYKTALERLRLIFEERPAGELARASVAGYEPLKAPRYG